MTYQARSILDRDLSRLNEMILRLTDLVEEAIELSIVALKTRDASLAHQVDQNDVQINELRYEIEEEGLRVLATQQPMAGDLRVVVAAIHVAVELERVGDHAAGIARIVERLEQHDDIDSLHQLPKMAKRARSMIRESVEALLERDAEKARALIGRDDKLDKQYEKLFAHTIREMRDDEYIYRATYLLWAGHNLERIGDRATNIAERAIFTSTGLLPAE